ncbi:CdaR family protein [Ornithinibacillus halotolerans]|uniref:CdaA regulatory protein CdaR n=1 Tax=Ornithinibacillus halotolerans TaxID=1274357 RepID=A0A916S2B5_9BACI|nr:CdaR family protein [Ornithinibacillus halotolerans]GGA78718.1 CdaA regulatory protein CdaR [Ornithinibacillus halotolerans]
MDNWFRSKWFIRGISLGFAILLYVFVAIEEADTAEESPISFTTLFGGSTQTETLRDIPLNIRIDSEDYVVSGVPETVSVTLVGPSSAVTPVVKQRNLEVFIDLRDLEEGEHEVEIDYENISSQLQVYIEPKTIDVMIEKRASDVFNVTVDFINTDKLPEGYQVGEYKLNTDTVTITSSKEIIDRIGIVKVFVDVAGLKESINKRELPVNVYDSQGNELAVRVEPETVIISADIENPSKKVPVSVATTGELKDGLAITSMEIDTKEVEIFAISEILDTIDEITTEPIDLSEITQSETIKVKLALPDKVDTPESVVEVEITLEQTKVIDAVSVNVDNLATGYEVNFIEPNTEYISISVTGNEQDVRELSADDFRAYLDASGLEAGRRTVPIEVSGPENIDVNPEVKEVIIEIVEE